MTTVSYSKDLRIRAINHIKAGNSTRTTAKVFSLGKSTVHRWWARYKTLGNVSALPRGGSKGKVSKEALLKYVDTHPDTNLYTMANRFGVSKTAIGKLLKKWGYGYKKKRTPTWKPTL